MLHATRARINSLPTANISTRVPQIPFTFQSSSLLRQLGVPVGLSEYLYGSVSTTFPLAKRTNGLSRHFDNSKKVMNLRVIVPDVKKLNPFSVTI